MCWQWKSANYTNQSIVQLLYIFVFRFIENIWEFCNALRLLNSAGLATTMKYCLASFSNDHLLAIVFSSAKVTVIFGFAKRAKICDTRSFNFNFLYSALCCDSKTLQGRQLSFFKIHLICLNLALDLLCWPLTSQSRAYILLFSMRLKLHIKWNLEQFEWNSPTYYFGYLLAG